MADELLLKSLADARASRANENFSGAQGIPANDAVTGFKAAPVTKVAPSLGMTQAPEARDQERFARDSDLLRDPAINRLAARSPAHVAATRDDWPVFKKISDLASGFGEVVSNIGMAAAGKNFIRPATTAFKTLRDSYNTLQTTTAGTREHDDALRAYDAAATAVWFTPFTGIANVFTHPVSRVLAEVPFLQKPGETIEQTTEGINEGLNFAAQFFVPFGFKAKVSPQGQGFAGAGRTGWEAPPDIGGGPGFVHPEHGVRFSEQGFVLDEAGMPAGFDSPRDVNVFIKTHLQNHPGEFKAFNDQNTGKWGIVRTAGSESYTHPPGVNPADTPVYQAQADAAAKHVKDIEDAITETKTHTDLPEVSRDFLEGTELATRSAWIDPEVIVRIAAQGHDLLSEHADAVNEALATGREVQIPLADYLADVAGKPYADELRKGTRFTEDGVSQLDAEELLSTGGQSMDAVDTPGVAATSKAVQDLPDELLGNVTSFMVETEAGAKFTGTAEELATLREHGLEVDDGGNLPLRSKVLLEEERYRRLTASTKKPTVTKPLALADLGAPIGPKPGGSNPGAIYAINGLPWLVKGDLQALHYGPSRQQAARATNEVLGSQIMNMVFPGSAPEMKVIDLGDQYGGGMGVASKMIPDLKPFNVNNADQVSAIQHQFALQVLLRHHDALGLTYDNIMFEFDYPINTDPGGVMRFRAQGMPKEFGPVADEWDSMRNPGIAPQAAKIYGPMTPNALEDSAIALDAVTEEKLRKLTDDEELIQTLLARKKDIQKRAGLSEERPEARDSFSEQAKMAAEEARPATWSDAQLHMKPGENGELVKIDKPTTPVEGKVFVPGGAVPYELNGIPFEPWDAPTNIDDWDTVEGQAAGIKTQLWPESDKAKASGILLQEPDGRIWMVRPTNDFGGTGITFPKGKLDPHMTTQSTAIKETYEESGLKAEITGYIGDYERTTSITRMWEGKRTGGSPVDMGWESQAVELLTPEEALAGMKNAVDKMVLQDFLASKADALHAQEIEDLLDLGMSPLDHPGKQFIEPSDLDTSDFAPDELRQWEEAKVTVKATLKKVANEPWLIKLFANPKALAMNKKRFVAYSKAIEKSFAEMERKLWEKTYNAIKQQYTAEWAAKYNELYPSVLNDTLAQPTMVAEHSLRFSKEVEADIRKQTALLDENGDPLTFYHGSQHFDIGTPDNPWRPVNQPVISGSLDPQFATEWKDPGDFNVWDTTYYNEKRRRTIYAINFISKRPADFRKDADVQKAARWHAEQNYDVKTYKNSTSKYEKEMIAQQMGLPKNATLEQLIARVAKQHAGDLARGHWPSWELPEMMKACGWDGAYMKESATNKAINFCVPTGAQVAFRYSPIYEQTAQKLSLSVKTDYDKALWGKLPKSMFAKDGGGMSADDLAEAFGFRSGEEMLGELTAFEAQRGSTNFNKFVKDITDTIARERTRAEVGDLNNPEKILADAKALFVAPTVESLLVAELQAMAAKAGGLPFTKENIQAEAKANFDTLPVKDAMRLDKFEHAMWRLSEQAATALERGDMLTAFRARQKQLLNYYQLEHAHFLKKMFDQGQVKFKRLADNPTISGMSQPFLNQLHTYLPKWGFTPDREPIELAEALGGVTLPEFVDNILRTNAQFPPIPEVQAADMKDLLVDDYWKVREFIIAMSRYARELQSAAGLTNRQNFDTAVEAAIEGLPYKKPPKKPPGPPAADSLITGPINAAIHVAQSIDAFHRKTADMIELFDRGAFDGPWAQQLTIPFYKGSDVQSKLVREHYNPVVAAWEAIPSSLKRTYDQKIGLPILAQIKSRGAKPIPAKAVQLYRRNIVPLALYTGTVEGLKKAAAGYGMTPRELLSLINAHIKPEEVAFVQAVWGQFEALAPTVSSVLRSQTGQGLRRVKAAPVTLGGVETAGGYWRIKFSREHNPDVAKWEDERGAKLGPEGVDDIFGGLLPNRGFSKERTDYVGPVDVNLTSLGTMFNDHIKYAAFARAVSDARKFMADSRIQGAVEQYMGLAYKGVIPDWIDAIVRPYTPHGRIQEAIDLGIEKLGRNISAGALVMNIGTMLAQAGGIPNAIAQLGGANPIEGTGRLLGGYGALIKAFSQMEMIDGELVLTGMRDMFNNSEMMRSRYSQLDQNMADVLVEVQAINHKTVGLKAANASLVKLGFHLIGWMEFIFVSGAEWQAAKAKALEAGKTEEQANYLADRAVVKSQGGSRQVDLASVQRQRGVGKLFYNFMSYWNQSYQLGIDVTRNLRGAGGGDPPRLPPPEDGTAEPESAEERTKSQYNWARGIMLAFSIYALGSIVSNFFSHKKNKWSDPAMVLFRPIAYAGNVAQAVERHVTFEKGKLGVKNLYDTSIDGNLIDRAGETALQAVIAGVQVATGKWKDVQQPARLVGGILQLFGAGIASPVSKAGQYLDDVRTGKQRPDPLDTWQGWADLYFGLTGGPQEDQKVGGRTKSRTHGRGRRS